MFYVSVPGKFVTQKKRAMLDRALTVLLVKAEYENFDWTGHSIIMKIVPDSEVDTPSNLSEDCAQ